MASPSQGADVATGRPMPAMEPAVVNPPATIDQLDAQDRARAAIGGTAAVRPRARQADDPSTADPPSPASNPRPSDAAAERRNRFAPPLEPPFEFTGPEPQAIRNTNIPLTIGILMSIAAAFLVFFISLTGGTAGSDPIMPSFWRGLGALAVFMTLSFAISWFMPAPADRRTLLNQLDAQDQMMEERYGRRRRSVADTPPETPEPQEEPDKGASIDVTLSDEELQEQEELEELEADELEEAYEDEDEDFVAAEQTNA